MIPYTKFKGPIEKVLHPMLQGLKVIKPEVYLIDSSCTCCQLTAAKMYYRIKQEFIIVFRSVYYELLFNKVH